MRESCIISAVLVTKAEFEFEFEKTTTQNDHLKVQQQKEKSSKYSIINTQPLKRVDWPNSRDRYVYLAVITF